MSQLWRRTTDNGRRNVKIELFWNRIRNTGGISNLWGRSGRWARRVRTRVLVVTSTDHIRTWVAVQERDLRILKINQSISLIIINWLSWDNTFKREQRLMHLVWSNTDGSEWPMVWLCWTYSCGGFHASFPLVKAEGGDHSLCCSERCCWRSSPGSCHTQWACGCGKASSVKLGFLVILMSLVNLVILVNVNVEKR